MAKTTKKKIPAAAAAKAPIHYTAPYIVDPQHPVTINVIGCGGTGSQVLNSLARMHSALHALDHPGLFVRAIDPDRVSEANMGRQLFSPADVDAYKCMVLIGRINRFFGTGWDAVPQVFKPGTTIPSANITISCVDSGAARKGIVGALGRDRSNEPYNKEYYWMDFGNMQDRGQVIIGTLRECPQPEGSEFDCRPTLPTVNKIHPDILLDQKGEDQGPSCSLAEALGKQDLFINTNLANMGLGLLWKLFREARIRYHGLYLNLENMSVNPLKV